MDVMRIPAERVAVLLGKNGATKRLIEKRSNVTLTIDKDCGIQISGDSFYVWRVRDVITAIGRGFNPEKALKILNEEYYLKVINLKLLFNSEKQIKRQKGRVIGTNGKTRRLIEETAEVELSIYGNTVAIIGCLEELGLAENAVTKLLSGTPHSGIYKLLEKGRKKLLEDRKKLWK
ncbi:MAG: KH domain-containing protein [Candidatus Micrarchaeota archaeon]